MNPRERLFTVLDGDAADHIPVWLLFPYHNLPFYVDVRKNPRYKRIFELSRLYAVTLNRRSLGVPLFTDEVKISDHKLSEGGRDISRTVYEWRGKRLSAELSSGPSGTTVRKLLEDERGLELFCSLPVDTDKDSICRHLDRALPVYLQEQAEFPMELGGMMLDLSEPITPLYGNANLEEFAVWSLSERDLIKDFLDRVMEQKRLVYQYCLERNFADFYFLVGSELAAPPLVGLDCFREWIVPYAKELVAMIHASGKRAIQHFHGQVKALLPDFMEMGADALHTIEAPPVGNCGMREAFEVVGDKLALIGNIQYDDFRSFSKEEMERAVLKLLDETAGRKFILSPTAGPYDPDVSENFLDNYEVMMRTAWEYKG